MTARLTGPTAGIVVIGDEILSGKVDEANARHLIGELRALGVWVRRVEVIPDEQDEIVRTVREHAARHDYVFTSGGVGPTHDDLTLPAVAAAFGMSIRRHPDLEQVILETPRSGDFHERDLRMADLPEGSRLLWGTPPDLTRWPVIAVENVFMLPGVPAIFRRKFHAIREMFRAGAFHSRAIYSREGEGCIAAALDDVVAEFPSVVVGSYPHLDAPDHKVQITIDGRDRDAVERAAARVVEKLGPAAVRRE